VRSIALAAAAALSFAACGGPATAPALAPATSAAPLPDLTFATLDGPAWSSASARGKVLVIDVWATYCKPCRDAFPRLDAVARAHPDAVVVGVSIDEGDDAVVRRYLQDLAPSFAIARDPGLSITKPPLAISRLPTLLVIDRAGKVRLRRDEAKLADYDALPALVDALTAER